MEKPNELKEIIKDIRSVADGILKLAADQNSNSKAVFGGWMLDICDRLENCAWPDNREKRVFPLFGIFGKGKRV